MARFSNTVILYECSCLSLASTCISQSSSWFQQTLYLTWCARSTPTAATPILQGQAWSQIALLSCLTLTGTSYLVYKVNTHSISTSVWSHCMMVDSGRQSLPDVSDEHPHHQHKHSRVWSHITLYDGRFWQTEPTWCVRWIPTSST